MMIVYIWILRLLLPVVFLRLAWRGLHTRITGGGIPERFGFIAVVEPRA